MTHGPLSWRELVERDKQKSEDAHNQIKRAAMQPTPRPQEAVMQSDIVQRLEALIERQRDARGDMLYKGSADPELVDARAEITRLTEALRAAEEREKVLREALAWYGEQARLARLIHSEGDAGRHALQDDGGLMAHQALAGAKPC